jgi:murein DD-endopeptidase MepM/ murein hydrolase activator NlpD
MGEARKMGSGARRAAALAAMLACAWPTIAIANDSSFETAPQSGSISEEPGPTITIGRGQDLVGRPIDIVAASRAALAALAAKQLAAAGIKGGRPSGMPVSARYMTSSFGGRYHPLLGGYRQHSGVDLAAASGSPIYATSDGVVSQAGWRGGYGLAVELNHGGSETRYAHMSQIAVLPGQKVRRGEVIGYVGSTGRSTGPHLHYEVRQNGVAVDPAPTLRGK